MGWREKLDGMEHFQLDLDLETKQYLQGQIERITGELRRMSHEEPWAEQMLYLMQIPGFGVVTGMTVLAAIGDVSRFESPKKLASYSGLVPGVEQSGVKLRGKGITKEGRRELRCLSCRLAPTCSRHGRWTDSPGGDPVKPDERWWKWPGER